MDQATETARAHLIETKYGAAKVWMVENKDLLNFSGIAKKILWPFSPLSYAYFFYDVRKKA